MADSDKPLVICLVGPTAAGKTDVAMALADRYPLDIVSVDSAMVYRHMNIGTAKPGAEVLQRYPHRLIDICEPSETYSAGRFRRDAEREIGLIDAAGRTPLLVGGTFLYFRALEHGLAILPGASHALRAKLDARAERKGWPAMHAELQRLDPQAAARIRPTDRQRIQRALEVVMLAGEPLSELQSRKAQGPAACRFLRIALSPSSRAELHARIEKRFDAMLEQGLIDEVTELLNMPGVEPDSPSMRAVGYRQIVEHLQGLTDLSEARRRAIVATRRLVKRQLTWLRAEPGQVSFDCIEAGVAEQVAEYIAGRIGR